MKPIKKTPMTGTRKIREAETYIGRINVEVPPEMDNNMVFSERLWEPSFLARVMELCSSASYQSMASSLNGLLRRSEKERMSHRTLQDTVCREGKRINSEFAFLRKAELEKNGFDPQTGVPLPDAVLDEHLVSPSFPEDEKKELLEKLKETADRYNKSTEDPEEQIRWETVVKGIDRMPENTVVLCIDDVGVHEQKGVRKKDASQGNTPRIENQEGRKKDARIGRKVIQTTVIYLRSKEGEYRFAAGSVLEAVLTALAYMLHWSMLSDRQLVIFSDGAKNIKGVVEKVFAFRPYSLYLDWYHLEKHCYEVLTMALTGGLENKERNESIRHQFDKRLFAGNYQDAIAFLERLDPSVIKNEKKLEEVKEYIRNKRDYIYVYALRRGLGIINSSNQGEKSNDLIVAQRCKHNGMSWTNTGIRGMRSIRLLTLNQETDWYVTHIMTFKPTPLSEKVAMQYHQNENVA